jgi:hypothetical protein
MKSKEHYISYNVDRQLYHGKRKGDIVENKTLYGFSGAAEVVAYGFKDNNSLIIKLEDGTIKPDVAERLSIVRLVEERTNFNY